MYVLTIYLFIPLAFTSAYFTPDFNNFLTTTYGAAVQQALERGDLKDQGSFGGRITPGEMLSKQAVVFVHGLGMNAHGFEDVREYFLAKGYTSAELYATTYGSGDVLSSVFGTDMKCKHVKRIRTLISAVQMYTGGLVDVIGYSMGSPISRKAILGGKCVENGKDLGASLTQYIDTFVGVAGANHGAGPLCFLQFGRSCGKITGMDCSSKFLADINNQGHKYEGHFVYSIYSIEDDVVGHKTCGKVVSAIPNEDEEFKTTGNHYDILQSTADLQYSLVSRAQNGK